MKKKIMILAGLMGAFVLGSCVDDNESASVTAVREAKAYQLKAMGDYYKAQGEALRIQAEAEAAYKAALATYNEALAAAEQAKKDKTAAEIAQIELQMQQEREKFAIELETAKAKAEAEIAKAKAEAIAAEQGIIDAANERVQKLYNIYAQAADQLYDLMAEKTSLVYDQKRLEGNLVKVETWIAEQTAKYEKKIKNLETEIEIWNEYSGIDKGALQAEYDAIPQKKYTAFKVMTEAQKAFDATAAPYQAVVTPYIARPWGDEPSSVAAVAAIEKVINNGILSSTLYSRFSLNELWLKLYEAMDLGLAENGDIDLYQGGSMDNPYYYYKSTNENASLRWVQVNGNDLPAVVYRSTDVEVADGQYVPLYAYNKYALPYADEAVKNYDPSATIESNNEWIKIQEEDIAAWETENTDLQTELEGKQTELEAAEAAFKTADEAYKAADAAVSGAQQLIADRQAKLDSDIAAEEKKYQDLDAANADIWNQIAPIDRVLRALEAEKDFQDVLIRAYNNGGFHPLVDWQYIEGLTNLNTYQTIYEQNLENAEARLEEGNEHLTADKEALTAAEKAVSDNEAAIKAKEAELAAAAEADKPAIQAEIDALRAQIEPLADAVTAAKEVVKNTEENWIQPAEEWVASAKKGIADNKVKIDKTSAKIKAAEERGKTIQAEIDAEQKKKDELMKNLDYDSWNELYVACQEKIQALQLECQTDVEKLWNQAYELIEKKGAAEGVALQASIEMNAAKMAVNGIETQMANNEILIASAQLTIDKLNVSNDRMQQEVADHDRILADWNAFTTALDDTYKAAVEGLKDNEAILACAEAEKAKEEAEAAYYELVNRERDLAQLLESNAMADPQEEIAKLNAQIEKLNKKIAELPEVNADSFDSKEYIESQIAELAEEIKLLETQIAEQQIRVDQCKAALDAAIAELPAE